MVFPLHWKVFYVNLVCSCVVDFLDYYMIIYFFIA